MHFSLKLVTFFNFFHIQCPNLINIKKNRKLSGLNIYCSSGNCEADRFKEKSPVLKEKKRDFLLQMIYIEKDQTQISAFTENFLWFVIM